MVKIFFLTTAQALFSPNDLKIKGMGGTETVLIHLAKHLAKTNDVSVYCNTIEEKEYNGVKYKFAENVHDGLYDHKPDILIVLRDSYFINFFDIKKHNCKVVLWCHDFVDTPAMDKIGEAINKIDKIVSVSEWHKENICTKFPEVKNKIVPIPLGVDGTIFNMVNLEKVHRKIIYASAPYRGLKELLDMFPKLRKIPYTELHIFSGMDMYATGEKDEYEKLYSRAKKMKQVVYHGTVPQEELARHMKESVLMVYPNTYDETCCTSIMQSLMCGTPVITSKKAALVNTMTNQPPGILIEGEPGSEYYNMQFLSYTKTLLIQKDIYNTLQKKCNNIDWSLNKFFKKWDKFLKEIIFSEKDKEI